MELTDQELLRRLEARDGALGERYRPHATASECRYASHYAEKNRPCPWCEAAERRREREGIGQDIGHSA